MGQRVHQTDLFDQWALDQLCMFQFYLNEHFWPAHLGGAFHQFLFVDGHLLLGQGLLCFQRRFLNVG
ncbi:hypothetical protein PsaNZ64_31545 [Pseudomonas syringae pv. actinidiae]|nr:hypothetical protein A3SM_11885 [Pseudomonas syringae pv. actinidiae ICMP 18886]EPN59978.1 hypothetical protein A235_25845 [Pseudomonas syringae pv. actinidiae ICMP 19079]OKS47029.1 hypothetical protein PsaNZ62_29110 [Pseudomonas syringae pv. actinidiae]OKS59100.1 hypothetical protein PsaNZ66_01235 [Pseudomonas syringae pv. actinidiae]OKS62532.1 hypothetical protein PsaNZ64_31545 [Pseudomonas syringae pv. actinidiae]